MKELVVLAALVAAADKKGPARPYVQSGPGGVFYARCVPADPAGTSGTTRVYRVEREKDKLLDTYGWYAGDGVTLAWSPVTGQVAVMALRPKAGVELSFHLGGKELASYAAADLGKLGVPVPELVDSTGRRNPRFRVVGEGQVPGTNDYDFVIEADGRQIRFDVLTGKPRQAGRQSE